MYAYLWISIEMESFPKPIKVHYKLTAISICMYDETLAIVLSTNTITYIFMPVDIFLLKVCQSLAGTLLH